jgi:hypothetical protein
MQIFEGSLLVVFGMKSMKGLLYFWHQIEYLHHEGVEGNGGCQRI